MIQTLNRFTTESLFDATSHLLSKLNIEFDRETAEPIDVTDLYEGPMPQYLTDALQNIKNTYFIGIVNDQSLAGTKAADSLDEVAETMRHGGKYDGMFVFACDAKRDANVTRTTVSALTRAFNRIASSNPVILIIRQNNLLSLSTCERMNYSQEWRQGSGEKLGKVSILRNINCEEPHRGHVDILDSLGDKAYNTFEELYKHWMEVFSSELLTKKFYNELSDWYAWAVMVAKFPNDLRTNDDDAKYNHEACIRLITRLIFVWFLKQKHLIPEEFFDEKYIRENLIEEFDPHARKTLLYDAEHSKYYRLILQNLFFAMLNCPIVAEGKTTPNNRRFMRESFQGKNPDYGINNIMRYKKEFMEGGADKMVKLANSRVPFLNGGLFDCLDNKDSQMFFDGFSEENKSLEQLFFPDYLFFGEEVGKGIDLSQWYDDKKKKNVSARGLIDILKRYSFTIEENTPYDQEVSLDPELLGKVFENLLAAYNPETKQSARKQTGSFYTPREIVQYMVDESLLAHLKRMCGDDMEAKYRQLLNYAADEVELSEEQRKGIMNAIYNCRVLDPACGSGAFPMGVLQQMVHVLKRIDPTNKMWESMMVDLAIAEAKKELEKVTSANEAEKAKIEENRKARLDDIESAFNQSINDPDYARKLYLIEHCIYGVDIQPIATQISKLRFFISLVVDQKPTKDAKSNFGIRPLPNLEAKFVTANTLIPLDRSRDLFSSCDDIRLYEEQLQDINHRIFLAKKNTVKKQLQEDMIATRAHMAQAMENNGFIGSKGYNQLMSWDMFNQNSSASFFDPEWMFGVKEGFDIVIGNPPYIDYRKIDSTTKMALTKYYSYKIEATGSLYVYFIEQGVKFLSDNCILTFINPYQYLSASSGKGIRHFIFNNGHAITCLVDVSNIKVFESASTYTCVNTIVKRGGLLDINVYKPTSLNELKENYVQINRNELLLNNDYVVLLSNNPIISKIDLEKRKLSDCCTVFCGLSASGFRNYVTTEKRDDDHEVFVEAKEIKRFITQPKKYIDTSIFSQRALPKFKKECLFMARMTSHMRVGKAHIGETAGKVNVLCEFKGVDCRFILGVLNSKLLDYYYCVKCESLHMNGGALPFDTESVKSLPIKCSNKVIHDRVCEIVSKILVLLDEDSTIDTSKLESEIDHLVYHLYNLTYDEVLIIDPETPITREEYDNFKLD